MNRTDALRWSSVLIFGLTALRSGSANDVHAESPATKAGPLTLTETAAGQALHTAWVAADYRFTPKVRAAFVTHIKAQAEAELAIAGETLPADFLTWVDSDPVVEASVYGVKDRPANVLRILRSLELDLGTDVVRKEYTQLVLAMAVSNVDHKDFNALGVDPKGRPLLKLVIPSNPLKPVDTKDPNRELDVNDHIINFLNDHPFEYEAKVPPAKKGDPVITEKRTRPMTGADVIASRPLQAKFNAYMEKHGQSVEVNCDPPSPSRNSHAALAAAKLFREAYIAKGLLPAARDAAPTLAETCAFLIRNDRYKFPPEANRVWPFFPLKAPWPALTFLALSRDPLRECEDIWQTFVETGKPLRKGPAYVGTIAQHINLLQARSIAPLDFSYGTVQMMCKDGGVCGVHSGVWAHTQQILGRPAATTREVGHCGTTGWTFNAKDNTYACGNNTGGPWSWVFSNPPMIGGDRYHRSTAYGINYGLQSYLDSFMAARLLSLVSDDDRQQHGLVLIKSGLEVNPYNILLMDAVGKLDPLTQMQMIQFVTALHTAAASKPGCPVFAVRQHEHFAHTTLTRLVPQDQAACREIYEFLKQEKVPRPAALTRYLAGAEGMEVALKSVEADLKAHLADKRDPRKCQIMTEKLNAAAGQISDKKERQAWALKRFAEMTGHEAYLHGRLVIDPTVTIAARLAGQRMPTQAIMFRPQLDQLTASLQAAVDGKPSPRLVGQCVAQARGIIPQITDLPQRKQWRQQLIAILGDNPSHQNFKRTIEKAGWRVVAFSRQGRGGAAAYAIDSYPTTSWHTFSSPTDQGGLPQEITVDTGEVKDIQGFSIFSRAKTEGGLVDDCAFYTSLDSKEWTLAVEKKFDSSLANAAEATEQIVAFAVTRARYFKFVARHALKGGFAAVAEIGVIEATVSPATADNATATRNPAQVK